VGASLSALFDNNDDKTPHSVKNKFIKNKPDIGFPASGFLLFIDIQIDG